MKSKKLDKKSFIAGYLACSNRADEIDRVGRDEDEKEAILTEALEAFEKEVKNDLVPRSKTR